MVEHLLCQNVVIIKLLIIVNSIAITEWLLVVIYSKQFHFLLVTEGIDIGHKYYGPATGDRAWEIEPKTYEKYHPARSEVCTLDLQNIMVA